MAINCMASGSFCCYVWNFPAQAKEIGAINSKETSLWNSIQIHQQLEEDFDFIFVHVRLRYGRPDAFHTHNLVSDCQWLFFGPFRKSVLDDLILKYPIRLNYMIQLKKTSQPQWRQQGHGQYCDVFEWSDIFDVM